ncbi:MAG TPA: YqjK family protein [Burkholderiales bacterium]|nr:YqjK family protein [Burkholderiales bacterium]
MSVDQHVALAVCKERLLERIETQRSRLAACGQSLRKPFALADKFVQAGCYVKQRPWIAGVGVLMAVVLSRRNLFGWVGRGWTLWRAWRFASRWLADNGYIKTQ